VKNHRASDEEVRQGVPAQPYLSGSSLLGKRRVQVSSGHYGPTEASDVKFSTRPSGNFSLLTSVWYRSEPMRKWFGTDVTYIDTPIKRGHSVNSRALRGTKVKYGNEADTTDSRDRWTDIETRMTFR
jgi:hypothetical protein